MAIALRPNRGGFVRAVGLGLFIRDYLKGLAPFGSPAIDPTRGDCQANCFYFYKLAVFRSYGEDAIGYENEARIKAGKPIYTPEEYEERLAWHMTRIPYKLTSCRYHSFVNYFGMLKKLGWLEATGEEERSSPQDYYEGFQSRVYYRLTKKGIDAPDAEWSNPKLVLYPKFSLEYHRQKRQEHHYSKRVPGRSHRAVRV